MLTCTKCGRDYDDDTLTICPVCGSVLVEKAENEDEEDHIPVATGTEDGIATITDFFHYSGITDVYQEYEESQDSFKLLVKESDYDKAKELLQTFNEEEKKHFLKEEQKASDAREQAAEEKVLYDHENKVYVKESEKYDNLRSSAYALVTVGILLLILELLDLFGIFNLHLSFASELLFQIVFLIMGIGFLAGGIVSFRRADSMKDDVKEEDELTEEVLTWFRQSFTAEEIDNEISSSLAEGEELSETEWQFERLEMIKSDINAEYEIPDESYVDSMTETLYQDLYESGDEESSSHLS